VDNDGLEAQGPKDYRFDKIVEHIMRPDKEVGARKYSLVRRHYSKHFRTRYINNL